MTALELLQSLNLLDETERIEAKRASEAGKSLLETVCAFANEPGLGGGWLLLGVVREELPLERLKAQLSSYPALLQRLCVNLAQRVHELTVASRNLLHNDAPARFAQWLLQRCPSDAEACELRLQERKRDIAQQLAMTPETLSRLMRSFESRGVIEVHGYQLRIHDLAALRHLAGQAGCSTR